MTPADLHFLLDRLGWSKTTLAARLGVSRSQLYNWLDGRDRQRGLPIEQLPAGAVERIERLTKEEFGE